MHKIVFDIETSNTFYDIDSNDPANLNLSLIAIYDSKTNEYSSYVQEELHKLWPILEKADMLIGYNSDHFDIPLLNKYYSGDLKQIKSLDVMKEVKNAIGRRPKLDHIAEATLGEKKIANGLEAIRWWRNGEIEKVRKYCLKDVEITKKIYDYAIEHNKLSYKQGGVVREILLDTSNWEKNEGNALTHTLPF